jgi:hypothetical protein
MNLKSNATDEGEIANGRADNTLRLGEPCVGFVEAEKTHNRSRRKRQHDLSIVRLA